MNNNLKIICLLFISFLFLGCRGGSKADRDVFLLSTDLNEITTHAEKKKSAPDMDMLLRVHLPPNPSRSEIINYINIIFTLSRNQRTYLASDPQVGMLAKIGHENIDLLLQASKPGVSWVKYGIEAINSLVDNRDQDLILKNLRNNYELTKVVYAKRWCEKAESILTEMVGAGSGYLPSEAIKCLASLKKPELYPILTSFMTGGWNAHVTYGIIKNLPGIDLTKALPKAWEASRNNNYQIAYLTRDTLASGYMPAFYFLFETIDDNNHVPVTIYNAEALIKEFTDQHGQKKELKAWYEKNKDNIIFDQTRKKYVVKT